LANTNPKQQATDKIIASQEEAWIDTDFEGRDQSSINRAVFGDETTTDPRFAPMAADAPMSLRNAITHMVASADGDPELRQQIIDAGAGAVLPRTSWSFFAKPWKIQIALQRGWWICAAVNEETREKRNFRLQDTHAGDRDAAMAAVGRVLNEGAPRTLSQRDSVRIQRLAAGGDLTAALGEYVMKRLPAQAATDLEESGDTEGFVNDPRWQPLYREAVLRIWHWGRFHADSNDAEWLAYIDKHTSGRVLNFSYLDALWMRYQVVMEEIKRERLLGFGQNTPQQEAEQEPDLDNLSDDEIERLRHDTLRAYAHQRRQA
jgi:hypothetical protein